MLGRKELVSQKDRFQGVIMRLYAKIFLSAFVVLILSYLPALAGQPSSIAELGYKNFAGMKAILDDFLVNGDSGSSDQVLPAIVIDGSGNFVIVWEDHRNGNSNPDIYAQRYSSSGAAVGPNFKVNDDTGSAIQSLPAAAMDGSGSLIIAWYDFRNGNSDIYAQRYNSSGTALGTNFKVNDDTGTAYQLYPVVAIDSSDDFVIAWQDHRNGSSNPDIYAQKYSSSGVAVDSNFKVNDDVGTSNQYLPAIAMNPYGNFVITWYDYRNGSSNPDIYAQRYSSSGVAEGSNFKVNDDVGLVYQYFPAIAMDSFGNFIITWQDFRSGNFDIYAQRFNSSGALIGSNFRVNADADTANQYYPVIASDGSGDFVITWQDTRSGNPDIYAQRYNSSGNPIDSNYLVSNLLFASFDQKYPAVAADGHKIYYVWQDNRRSKGWDIYAKVVDWTWTKVGDDQAPSLPNSFQLFQNYPNPFNQSTEIEFILSRSDFVSLNIYDILGRRIKTLVSENSSSGHKSAYWDGKDNWGKEVCSGVYFYQLKVGEFSETKKMLLLK
jgi:hypothetical protein